MENYIILDMKKQGKSMDYNRIVVCRGGGDLATGIIHRLAKAGSVSGIGAAKFYS